MPENKEYKTLNDYSKDELIDLVKSLKRQKKFGLVWEDKPEEVATACEEKIPVLEEITDKAVTKADGKPTNIIIEGDNYHSLSALNYTHAGKIDVIYIDPPYNTGNKDFIYNDSYVDQEDGYRHSKWLSFMSKRLFLAKTLLADTGIILLSIDDNELAHLRLLCDSIFGEKNFINCISVKTKDSSGASGGGEDKKLKKNVEYLLFYARNKKKLKFQTTYVQTNLMEIIAEKKTRRKTI
ncbi:MAG: site-specific DNA-methyltransferase [Micrococcaceae bacterium]